MICAAVRLPSSGQTERSKYGTPVFCLSPYPSGCHCAARPSIPLGIVHSYQPCVRVSCTVTLGRQQAGENRKEIALAHRNVGYQRPGIGVLTLSGETGHRSICKHREASADGRCRASAVCEPATTERLVGENSSSWMGCVRGQGIETTHRNRCCFGDQNGKLGK